VRIAAVTYPRKISKGYALISLILIPATWITKTQYSVTAAIIAVLNAMKQLNITTMSNNTQLPAEVVKEIKDAAKAYTTSEVKGMIDDADILPGHIKYAYEAGATEYATKLQQEQQENIALRKKVAELENDIYEGKGQIESLDLAAMRQSELVQRQQLEIDNLKLWQKEAMDLLNPLFAYGAGSKEIKLGQCITAFILDRLKRYDALRNTSSAGLTWGAPSVTGTYFAVMRPYVGDKEEMIVLEYYAHKNLYLANGNKIEVEDIIGYIPRESHAERPPVPIPEKGAIWITGQYERLYDQLKEEPERKIICWVDYDGFKRMGDLEPCRDICSIRGVNMSFIARGISYGDVQYLHGDHQRKYFIELCEQTHVQWLDESAGEKNGVLRVGLKFRSKVAPLCSYEVVKIFPETKEFKVKETRECQVSGTTCHEVWSIEGFEKYYNLGVYYIQKEVKP
jgi:hypothetical protein